MMKLFTENIFSLVFPFFFLINSCSPSDKDASQGAPRADALDIPAHIQNFDNLKVYQSDAKPKASIQFNHVATITDDVGIGSMGNLAVDDKGRIFISEGGLNQNRQTIYVFNPDGSYLTRLGREGGGPGEFRSISNIQVNSGYLHVFDPELLRVTIFSLNSLTHIRTVILKPESWRDIEKLAGFRPDLINTFARNDSTYLLGFQESLLPNNVNDRYRRYYLVNWEGNIISDMIFEEKDANFHGGTGTPGPQLADFPTLAFKRNSLKAVSDEGTIYSAWTEDFLIKKYDSAGNYHSAIFYSYDKSLLNRNDILERYEDRSQRFQQGVRNTEFPETWPALNAILLDEKNKLWVSTIIDDEDQYGWWVLQENGELLSRFEWNGSRLYRDSRERQLKLIKNGYLYTVEADRDTGSQKVVIYKIQFNQV